MLFIFLFVLFLLKAEHAMAAPSRPNQPVVPECMQSPVDIALLIDSTSSIGSEDNFTLGLNFIREFLNRFEISKDKTRVAAVMFGQGVYSESAIPFDKYNSKQKTLDAISSLEWMGGQETQTGKGIDYVVDNFIPHMRDDADVAHVGIVLTDGQSQDKNKTKDAAARAKAQGLTMIAVGVGRPKNYPSETGNGIFDMEELTAIAGKDEFVLIVGDYSKLQYITDLLSSKLCIAAAQYRGRT